MQSRLVGVSISSSISKLGRLLYGTQNRTLFHQKRSLASAPIPTGIPADPAIYSEPPDDEDAEAEADEAAKAVKKTGHRPDKENGSPKPPYAPSPKLESTPVNQPTDPITQQKRYMTRSNSSSEPLKDVSCVGLDGSPWPEEEKGREKQRGEEEEDDKEYFKHHKASPLSEMEMADTRKPISRATDGTADSRFYGGADGVVLWRPEQLDTAEEALRRAAELFRQSAMRGDPDSPHGRVLRAMRGETW